MLGLSNGPKYRHRPAPRYRPLQLRTELVANCNQLIYGRPMTTMTAADNDSIAAALAVIGDRWSLLVIRSVFRGQTRFSGIRDDIGIASNLLTNRLSRLVDKAVLERQLYSQRPERYEYRLTDAGRDLSPVLISLMQWGDTHRNGGQQPTVLVHDLCGTPVHNATRCGHCEEVVDATAIRRAT